MAVTIGPGLSLCLRVGVAKARQIAREHNLPIIHCHHMEVCDDMDVWIGGEVPSEHSRTDGGQEGYHQNFRVCRPPLSSCILP